MKYAGLPVTHSFTPAVAVETSGVFTPDLEFFFKELDRRETGEEKTSSFLYQKISAAVQHGNAISILGGHPIN